MLSSLFLKSSLNSYGCFAHKMLTIIHADIALSFARDCSALELLTSAIGYL